MQNIHLDGCQDNRYLKQKVLESTDAPLQLIYKNTEDLDTKLDL